MHYNQLSTLIKVLFITGLSCLSLSAQDYFDIATFSHTSAFSESFSDVAEDKAIQEFNLNLDIPLVNKEDYMLISGITANSLRLGFLPSTAPTTNLYAISLRLGVIKTYSEKWSGTYLIIPKIASDLSSGFRKGKQIGAIGLLTHTSSERLKHTFGLYMNTEEFGLLMVPIVGIYHLSENGHWETNLLLPIRADINYKWSKKFTTGLHYDGLGSSYDIKHPGFPDHYVTRSSLQLSGYGEVKLGSSLLLRAKLGYSFFRNYKVYQANDKIDLSIAGIFFGQDRTERNRDFNDDFFFKTELVYRFDLSGRK